MIQLPNEAAVRELLSMMVGSEVAVHYSARPALQVGTAGAIARYVDDDGAVQALGACDLLVANALGHALAMLPQQRVSDAVASGAVPADAAENLHEIFNVGANLLNAPDRPHLRLDAVLTGADIPAELAADLAAAIERLDLDIEVPGYGSGPFALVLPAGSAAPGLESPTEEDESPGGQPDGTTQEQPAGTPPAPPADGLPATGGLVTGAPGPGVPGPGDLVTGAPGPGVPGPGDLVTGARGPGVPESGGLVTGAPAAERPAGAVVGAAAGAPAGPRDSSLDAFDFEAPLPLPATAPRLVGRVQDVSPRIGVALSVACGRTVVVTCTGAERVSSGHLAQAGVTWCYVDCGAFGRAILAVPAALTVSLADTLMGGSGKLPLAEGAVRPATTLEQRLVLRHLGPALQPLVLAFSGNGLTALVVGEPETHALPASIGDLVALRLSTHIEGSGQGDTITLALPAQALLPGADLRLIEPPTATAAALGEVPVEVSLQLSATPMSAAEVESLGPGDVVRLEHPVDRPLLGLLDDHVVLHATLGRRGRRRAVRVTDLLGGS